MPSSFGTPSDNVDPYYKQFFTQFNTFLELFVRHLLPALAAVAVLFLIVFGFIFIFLFLGFLLGILPTPANMKTANQTPKDKQADTPGFLQAGSDTTDKETLGEEEEQHDLATSRQLILEKSLLKIEIDILKEMQQTRQAKLDELDESDSNKR